MEKYEWKSNIKLTISILRVMGFWPIGAKSYKPGPYVLYTSVLVLFFIIGHISFQIINIYFIRDNLEALAASSYILLVEILGAFKAYYLIKNMAVLKQLLQILSSHLFQPKNDKQRALIEPSIYFWKTIYNTFLVMCIGSDAFWAVFPFLDKPADGRRLPFLAWYPYNSKVSPFYEATYVYQIVSISYLTLVHVNVDTLIAAFNMYTGCQFDILGDSLRNLETRDTDVKRKLLRCIDHHKQILTFVENCNKFFNWILFLQFLISAIAIGITLFQLSLVQPLSSEFITLVSYETAIILEIFMYCWFGNEVQLKSNQLPYAVFESDWTVLPLGLKKDLLFFTMNLLKPVRLSALNLFYLSLETFMKILKTAWSYFALLHQLNI